MVHPSPYMGAAGRASPLTLVFTPPLLSPIFFRYEGEPNVVWERLTAVDGDTTFVTAEFAPLTQARYAGTEPFFGRGGADSRAN